MDIFRFSGFNMKAPGAVADLTTCVLKLWRIMLGPEPARFSISRGVTFKTLHKFCFCKTLFHDLDAFIRVGLLGIGLEVFIFCFMALLTGLGAHIGFFRLRFSLTDRPCSHEDCGKNKRPRCRPSSDNL